MSKGKLILTPTPIGDDQIDTINDRVKTQLLQGKYFITEGIRTTRRYLKAVDKSINIDAITFFEYDKNGRPDKAYLEPCLAGLDVLFCSEAGLPCIADPGAGYVNLAREMGIEIQALSGPNSILLALMLSGFNGQRFEFHGYLPIKTDELKKKIKSMEREMKIHQKTHLFIETPYRNWKMCQALSSTLSGSTMVAIMADIGSPEELQIKTMASELSTYESHFTKKRPAVFLIGS